MEDLGHPVSSPLSHGGGDAPAALDARTHRRGGSGHDSALRARDHGEPLLPDRLLVPGLAAGHGSLAGDQIQRCMLHITHFSRA